MHAISNNTHMMFWYIYIYVCECECYIFKIIYMYNDLTHNIKITGNFHIIKRLYWKEKVIYTCWFFTGTTMYRKMMTSLKIRSYWVLIRQTHIRRFWIQNVVQFGSRPIPSPFEKELGHTSHTSRISVTYVMV